MGKYDHIFCLTLDLFFSGHVEHLFQQMSAMEFPMVTWGGAVFAAQNTAPIPDFYRVHLGGKKNHPTKDLQS